MLPQLIEDLRQGHSLTGSQVQEAVDHLVDERVATDLKAEFLAALSRKGETPEEIAAFALELRNKSIAPTLDAGIRSQEVIDVCGTGGDRLNTFNISTTVGLLVAAAGVIVAKHGNRAVTSQSGSADVLEALGIRTELGPDEAARWLGRHGFAFFFAPSFHPAFRQIGPARRLCAERGQRTIFNFLGPLLNPARPSAQLIGVPRPALCEPLARVLQSLGVRRGMVVSGRVEGIYKAQTARLREEGPVQEEPAHLDELSTLGPTTIAEFYQERGFSSAQLSPEGFPLQPARLEDLAGGGRDLNAEIIRRLLRGEERGPRRDAVLLNSAAALLVGGKARSLAEGWDLAAQTIDSGKARAKLEELVAASSQGS